MVAYLQSSSKINFFFVKLLDYNVMELKSISQRFINQVQDYDN